MLKVLAFILVMQTGTAFADNMSFGDNTQVVSSLQEANATCFLYENNEYKCACSQLKSRKKLIWSSKPMQFFNGKLSNDTQYIYARRCE